MGQVQGALGHWNIIKKLFINKPNRLCDSAIDGFMLFMHYRCTVFMILLGFAIVSFNWHYQDVIECVSTHSADVKVTGELLNICLSYPYVEDDGSRQYVTFYRWLPWSLLPLAVIYYLPRILSKKFDNSGVINLFKDIAPKEDQDDQSEENKPVKKTLQQLKALQQPEENEPVEKALQYLETNLKTHNGLYLKFLFVNVMCVVVDICAFLYLNYILQGHFIPYGIMATPNNRDREYFTDYMSKTFPPFVSCEVTEKFKLINDRTEKFGCHLPLMELYEKSFLFLWYLLIVLLSFTIGYIFFLCSMLAPCGRVYLLRFAKPATHDKSKVTEIIKNVKNCKIGDFYLLYCLKSHLSHAEFYELMSRMNDPNLCNIEDDKQPLLDGENENIHMGQV